MSRLSGMLRSDFKLQQRYGFWYAGLFVTLVWTGIFALIPAEHVDLLVPFMLFVDLAGFGFFFIAGLVLFERDEGVLSALVASPLRSQEYLSGRLISLSALALAVSLATTLAVYAVSGAWASGGLPNLLALIAGTLLTSVLITLIGFIAVAPYENLSHFLLPASLMVSVLQLPLLGYFDFFPSRLWWLLPSQGALWFLESAVRPVPGIRLALGGLYSLLWIALLWRWAVSRFERYIVRQEQRS
jgi:fluoroquinolone transport system permease protein